MAQIPLWEGTLLGVMLWHALNCLQSIRLFAVRQEQCGLWLPLLYTYTRPFNGPFSGTTWLSWYQKGKTNLDFTEARDSEWQWHQLGHMLVCTLLQTDNHASTPPLSFCPGQMPFLPPNLQCQSTEGHWLPLL